MTTVVDRGEIGHYHLYGPALSFQVLGAPISQGNIRHFGKGRPAVHQNAHRLLPWRELVQHAAEAAIAAEDGQWYTFPLDGPVGLYVCFTMPKAKSASKTRTTYPDKRPDASHLLRAVEDALTNAGVWKDDSQIIDDHAVKAYPNEHVQALHVPGAVIRVYTIGERSARPIAEPAPSDDFPQAGPPATIPLDLGED